MDRRIRWMERWMDGFPPSNSETDSAARGPELENPGTTSGDAESVGLEHGLVISV